MATLIRESKQRSSSADFFQPGQHAIVNRTGKTALDDQSESNSAIAAPSSFAHDFSQVPVRASEAKGEAEDTSFAEFDCPPHVKSFPRWHASDRIFPEFLTVDEIKHPPEITSGYPLKPSITTPWRAPTVTGRIVADCQNKMWRYQLTSFQTGGDIFIYYYTPDHYPAPGPPYDDKAPLTNVTKQNWKEMVAQLEERKASAAKFWDAYQSQDLHEAYHWNVHWKGVMYELLPKLEESLNVIGVPFMEYPSLAPKPTTAAEAETILEPKMQHHLARIYNLALAFYLAIPDQPGDSAYQAQAPAFRFLINRIKNHAKNKGWLSTSTKDAKEEPSSEK